MVSTAPNPPDLLDLAKRLREVRTACRRFLMLWAMGSSPKGLAGVDLSALSDSVLGDPDAMLRALADPKNRDWTLLYQGDVLDD